MEWPDGGPGRTAAPVRIQYRQALSTTKRLVRARYNSRAWPASRQDELASAVMEKYTAKFGRDAAPDNPEAWLTRVIQTTARDMVRDERETPDDFSDAVEDHSFRILFGGPMRWRSVGSDVVNSQLLEQVLALVPAREATLLRLKYADGRSAREIADLMGLPSVNAADQAVSRARRALAAALSERPDLVAELGGRPPRESAGGGPEACPACGSTDIVPIVYGYPSLRLFERAQRGEVALGGCCVTGSDPTRSCQACGHRW